MAKGAGFVLNYFLKEMEVILYHSDDGELEEQEVVSKMEITSPHDAIYGKTQTMEAKFYNLDAIISFSHRANSKRATYFRIWATGILQEYGNK